MVSWRWIDPRGLRHSVIERDHMTPIVTRDYMTGCGFVLSVDDVTKNRRSKGGSTCLWCAAARRAL